MNSSSRSFISAWAQTALAVLAVVALVASLGLSFFSQPDIARAVTTNLVTNGDFESGTGTDVNNIPDWNEEGTDNDGDPSTYARGGQVSGQDSSSPDGGRFAKIAWDANPSGPGGKDEWICQKIDASGYKDLTLEYYWRGDDDAEHDQDDYGHVEYRATSNGSTDNTCKSDDSSWTQLATHPLDAVPEGGEEWSSLESVSLPSELNDDDSWFIRFRAEATTESEHFRVDGIKITGDEIKTTIQVKKLIDADGNLDTTDDQTPASEWEFTINESSPYTTDGDGLTVVVDVQNGHEYDITEVLDEQYDLLSASCVGASEDNGDFDSEHATIEEVEVEEGDEVLCTFINAPIGEDTSETIVVDTNNQNGWFFVDDTDNSILPDDYVFGPGTAPLGDGSARLVALVSSDKDTLVTGHGVLSLSDIITLTYKTYQTTTSGAPAIALQFNIDDDITDADNSWKGRLVYEPYYTHTIQTGVWQSWDTQDNSESSGNGNWWFSNGTLASDTGCSISTPCTWSEILTALPDGGIHPTLGAVLFKAGSGWTGFDGNVDEFVFGVKSGVDTHTITYDFEPVLVENSQCTVTIYSDTTNTVVEKSDFAKALTQPFHVAWTAIIDGASWIWGDDPVAAPTTVSETQTFVKTFEWSGPIDSAVLHIAADNFYTATLNGTEVVSEQAVENNFQLGTQDGPVDVSSYIVEGVNTLEIEVTNKELANSSPTNNPAGLLYSLIVTSTEDGDACQTAPVPVENSCALPDADVEAENIELGSSDEQTLQSILDEKGYSLDADNDQENYETWVPEGVNVSFTTTFLRSIAGDDLVFGYYLDSDLNTFVPLFEKGDHSDFLALSPASEGDTESFTIPNFTTIGFAIHTEQDDTKRVYATETALNADGDHAVVYNPEDNTYVIAFEDRPLSDADGDHNDMVVKVVVDGCESFPVCELNQELLTNGDFEHPTISGSWDIVASGYPGLGWIVDWFGGSTTYSSATRPTLANIELQKSGLNGWTATSTGSQWAELDSDWVGPTGSLNGEPGSIEISQQIFTEIGETYTFSFDFSPRPGTAAAQNVVEVLINGTPHADSPVGPLATAGNQTEWTRHSFSFVADSILTTVTLRDAGTPNDSLGTFIDNASLMCTEPEPEPQFATVTLCKVDEQSQPLQNWTLTLLGKETDSFSVPAADVNGVDSTATLTAGTSYVALVSGTWLNNRNPDNHVDAEYSTEFGNAGTVQSDWGSNTITDGFTGYGPGILELEINETDGYWGPYNGNHQYAQSFVPITDGTVNFRMFDGNTTTHIATASWYGDNKGSLDVAIHEGYAGVTNDTGCVVFENVPFGEYVASEVLQDGWVQTDGPTNPVQIDTEIVELSLENTQLDTITVEKWSDANQDGAWNDGEDGISGWDIVVKPQTLGPVETLVVDSLDANGETTTNTLTSGRVYLVEVEGTWKNGSNRDVDAEYYSDNNWSTHGDIANLVGRDERQLDLVIDNKNVAWGSYNSAHLYKTLIEGADGTVTFRVFDEDNAPNPTAWYGDNDGTLTVRIYDVTNYVVTTGDGGVATFEVLPGEYQVVEMQREGWVQTAPTGPSYCHLDTTNDETSCSFGNYETPEAPELATLVATKIVCDAEQYLPNWGGGSNAPITVDTASNWLNASSTVNSNYLNSEYCHLEDWDFQWVTNSNSSSNPGDETEVAGGAWSSPFTNSTTIPAGERVWVREVFEPGYIEFTGQSTQDSESAEFYCSTDVLNYDNWEWIDPVNKDETYYCVAWNAPLPGAPELTIIKETDGYDGEFDFSISGPDFSDSFSIETDNGFGTTTITLAEEGGTFTLAELLSEAGDWELAGISCEYNNYSFGTSLGDNEYQITVENGDSVTCTFVNETTCNDDTEYFNEDTQECTTYQGESVFDLSVDKTVNHDGTPAVGETVTYTITVTNEGPSTAGNIEITDLLPSGVTYVSHDASNEVDIDDFYDEVTGVWTIASLGGDEGTATLEITATINSGEEGKGIVNTATLTDYDINGSETNSNNNADDASFTVQSAPTITTQSTPTPPGGGVTTLGGGFVAGAFTSNGQVLGESCGLYLNQHLRWGNPANNPEQVRKLQEFLNKHGYGAFSPTGYFGPLTFAAVNAFQTEYASSILAPWNLNQPTGLVYLTTLLQINKIECPSLTLELPPLIPWSQNSSN